MLRYWLCGLSALIAAQLTSLALAQGRPEATRVDESLAPYASTAHSVLLPGGRTVHLTCAGRGSPTVILTAGGGDWGATWNKVQPALSTQTRVCAWDRAGFGLSGPSPVPQTADNTTSDLEAALKSGGIYGPFVLVGHSQGAYESLLFADRHRSDVVGIVLVDPSIPDQAARMRQAVPAIYGLTGPSSQHPFALLLQKCAAAIRAGKVSRSGADPDGCLHPPPPPASYPPALRHAMTKQSEEASPSAVALAMDTISSSFATFDESSKIVVSPHRNYRNMPLVVLTAGEYIIPDNVAQTVKDEVPTRQAVWRQAHDELAALSRQGINRVVLGSSHDIQGEKPQAVIDAVNEVVAKAHPTKKVS
jgi:pimeloyl-ACP methyl ester carboxylesterase